MIEKRPNFNSQIPEHLLTDSSPRDRYMLEQLSVIRQETNWQTDKLLEVDGILQETRGKVEHLVSDIETLKGKDFEYQKLKEDLVEIVEVKQFVDKYIWNRNFLVIFIIFLIGFVKIMYSPTVLEWIKTIWS
jgi:hypothetical protein